MNVSTSFTRNTPLHLAASRGYGECVALLLQQKQPDATSAADLNAPNDKGLTPFHIAVIFAKDELAKNSGLVCIPYFPSIYNFA